MITRFIMSWFCLPIYTGNHRRSQWSSSDCTMENCVHCSLCYMVDLSNVAPQLPLTLLAFSAYIRANEKYASCGTGLSIGVKQSSFHSDVFTIIKQYDIFFYPNYVFWIFDRCNCHTINKVLCYVNHNLSTSKMDQTRAQSFPTNLNNK